MVDSTRPSPLMKILIVDDMKSIRRLVSELLKPLGAIIYEAENGQDAIDQIINMEFDVVLMDIEMPIINGLTALKQLRDIHGFKHLPVIMMTGLTDESLVSKAFNEGAYDYVRKPIHAEELLARVHAVFERKRVDREMYFAKKQAEQSNKAKSEFVSHMAHELNTPLNAIYGYAQLLELDGDLNNNQMEFVKDIIQAAKLQKQLIEDSLDLAKIEAGIIDITMTELSLYESLKEAFTLTQPIADKHGINIQRPKRSDTDIYIEADKKRLTQVLLNLISNAIKYNKPDGEINIRISSLPGKRVRIGIEDTGIGIAEDKLPQMFEAFNRLGAEDSNVEGNGIGLSITKRMVEGMHGTLDVESVYEKGSTFWVELNQVIH